MSTAKLTPVRKGHEIDEVGLEQYLTKHQPGFVGPLTVQQFEGGQSNPTFLLETGAGRFVLRKQPPGELLPSAHQVDREYRVMAALADTAVPVPRMRCLCLDRTVLGAQFYVMDYLEGRMFSDATLPGVSSAERGEIYRNLAQVLAALHSLDPVALGLEDFGRAGNYFERQISRWTRQYQASATEDIAAMERLMEWLPANIPESGRTAIVHGDYRIGNCLVSPTGPEIAGVIDWELSTLGDPLADLGYVCQMYHISAFEFGLAGKDLRGLGIPAKDRFVEDYCRFASIDSIEGLEFSIIYNLFRLAGISQGVYKRGLEGNASSAQAMEFKGVARDYSETAWAMVEGL